MQSLKTSIRKLKNRLSGLSGHKADERTTLIDKSAKYQQYLASVPHVLHYKDYELPADLIHPKVLDDLTDFEIRQSDVLIVSYPQSGSSVAEDLVSQILTKVNESQTSGRGRWKGQVARLEEANPFGHMRWLHGLKSPRILTSNLPLELLPQEINSGSCKIVYVIRNPKDLSISYFYQHRVKSILSSFDDFFDLFLTGHLLYGDYFSHVIQFWQLYKKFPENVFFVSFEELKLETFKMAKLIVNFIGCELKDEEINQLPLFVQKASQEEQKSSGSDRRHFEAVIGDWNNYYKPEQSRQIDRIMTDRFEPLGLSICCDPTEANKRLNNLGRIVVDISVGANQTKADRSQKKATNDKTKLVKEEFVLLRNKSLSKIEIVSDNDSVANSSSTCCSSVFGLCCPCLQRRIDYTRV